MGAELPLDPMNKKFAGLSCICYLGLIDSCNLLGICLAYIMPTGPGKPQTDIDSNTSIQETDPGESELLIPLARA